MENRLLCLKSIIDMYLSSSFNPWVIDTIFGILYGLGLFLLLLAFFDKKPSSPPPRNHRNIRRVRNPWPKPNRDDLFHLESLPDKDGFCQLSCRDPPGKVCEAEPDGAYEPCWPPVEDSVPTMSPSASLAPLTLCPLPLASALSAEHQEDQSDMKRIPLGTTVKSSPPGNSFAASPIPAISAFGYSSCPIKLLSWWWAATKALLLPTSSQRESPREHLSHHPPEASFWGDPTDRQVETGSPSFVNPDVQKLLEILITKRAELNIWKEKEKDGSFSKQMSSDHHLNSLGNIWKSLGPARDSITPQSFWNIKDKQGQLPSSQQLPLPMLLGDHQQKCNQFWGLPSLHSESLVAAAWVTRSSSHLRFPSVLFNGISSCFPIPVQPTTPSRLSQAPPLSFPGAQPQPLAQIPTQSHLSFSLPIQPPSSQPQGKISGVSCPKSQDKAHSFIPTEIQCLKWPLLRKQLKRKRTLPFAAKRSLEVFSQLTPNLPQDNRASQGQRSVSSPHRDFISPNLQKQHLQRRLLKDEHQDGQCFRIQVSLELMQAQGKFPGMCQAQDKQGPLQPSVFTGGSSQDSRKMKSRGLASFPAKVLAMNPKKESERYLMRPSKSDSGSHLPKGPDKKDLEKILKAHLSRKLEQVKQGLIPVRVRQSWLSAKHNVPKCHTHMETRNLASLKGQEFCINTTCELSTLSPRIEQLLEAHIVRLHVKHRWGLSLQAFESIHLKISEAQHSPLPQSPFPSSDACVSGDHSKVKFTNVLGKPSKPLPSKKVITKESFPTLTSPVPAASPACEEIQKAMEGTRPDCDHGPSQAPLTEKNDKLPSQLLTLSLMGRTQQIGTVMGVEKRSLEPSPSSVVAKNEPRKERRGEASRHPCLRLATLDMNLGSQSS
ncbi:LOW QUALITY PROTEIN: spermatogenesis-associated protein 31A6-like [Hipposideros larvatus]